MCKIFLHVWSGSNKKKYIGFLLNVHVIDQKYLIDREKI